MLRRLNCLKLRGFLYILKPHFTHPWQVLHLGQYWAFTAIFTEHEASSWTQPSNLGENQCEHFSFYYCLEKAQCWDMFHSTVADCMGKMPSLFSNALLFSFWSAPFIQPLSALLHTAIILTFTCSTARERGWAEWSRALKSCFIERREWKVKVDGLRGQESRWSTGPRYYIKMYSFWAIMLLYLHISPHFVSWKCKQHIHYWEISQEIPTSLRAQGITQVRQKGNRCQYKPLKARKQNSQKLYLQK